MLLNEADAVYLGQGTTPTASWQLTYHEADGRAAKGEFRLHLDHASAVISASDVDSVNHYSQGPMRKPITLVLGPVEFETQLIPNGHGGYNAAVPPGTDLSGLADGQTYKMELYDPPAPVRVSALVDAVYLGDTKVWPPTTEIAGRLVVAQGWTSGWRVDDPPVGMVVYGMFGKEMSIGGAAAPDDWDVKVGDVVQVTFQPGQLPGSGHAPVEFTVTAVTIDPAMTRKKYVLTMSDDDYAKFTALPAEPEYTDPPANTQWNDLAYNVADVVLKVIPVPTYTALADGSLTIAAGQASFVPSSSSMGVITAASLNVAVVDGSGVDHEAEFTAMNGNPVQFEIITSSGSTQGSGTMTYIAGNPVGRITGLPQGFTSPWNAGDEVKINVRRS